MIPPHLIVEPRFLRSSLAAFAQMFTLGAVLVAMPLYFTGPLELSSSQAGVLFFVLPLAMAVMAPLVSRLSNRESAPRLVLRSGLAVIIVAALSTGALTRSPEGSVLWPVAGLLVSSGWACPWCRLRPRPGRRGHRQAHGERRSACSTCSDSPDPPPARPGSP